MRLLPGTLLARTVLVIGALLVVSLAAWLTLFTLAEREPRAHQTATRVTSLINLTRAALLAAQPERRQALLAELSQREGIRIVPLDPEELTLPPPERPFLRLVWRELQAQLGEDTLLVGDEFDDEALWVSFSLGPDDYWLVLPRVPHREGVPWQWIGWGALTLLLAFAGGWAVVARINRPLKDAAAVAAHVGRGRFDTRLDEQGPAEIAALARAFNHMSANLSAMEADRKLMLAGLSHDLRTPLTRLRLAVEMQVGDAAEREAMIQDMDDIDALARQFLEFARPEPSAAATELDVDALCRETIDGFAQRGLPVALHGTAGKAWLPADGLRRALINLLENAHRYGRPPVSIELAREPDTLLVTVTDCGTGLDETALDAAKRPFYRGDAARTGAQGTGLGLAIVERFARQCGGSLTLSNRTDQGLAARLSLPVRPAPGNPAPPLPRP
ncbi:MAG: HAMP domain-containing protein [Thiobacillus sp.]|nr:HAMP domain-containing protein [Thiobacillus sp.]